MYLRNIQIVNYKNFINVNANFETGSNTVIGENDSGKSNFMEAIRILLDGSYFYNEKRLKESDFSDTLIDWRGHWIIISACFGDITQENATIEVCQDMIPAREDEAFVQSCIRCKDLNYGTVTLYIRPSKAKRRELFDASGTSDFDAVRKNIVLEDYEFYYTTKSQEVFTNSDVYTRMVGDIERGKYSDPNKEDSAVIGSKVNILEVWQHISFVFIDALRDVQSDLKKSRNPIRRIVDAIKSEIKNEDISTVKEKITDLNDFLGGIDGIADIGISINSKLQETIGMVYAPDIKIESHMKDDINLLSKYLNMSPSKSPDLDYLGLGHLNMIYIALKLVEFEYNRKREILNIMIVEEPEAHVHAHIQKTLFKNLQVSKNYTQVLMTSHSTHLSEVSDISSLNILKSNGNHSIIMSPTNKLEEFGKGILKVKDVSFVKCLERYLDAKRSVLLFSKAVILVEGDGEEILLPSLIKNVLGVTLDELGIGLINVGSVGFENIASIFDEERLQRRCAIITDMDQTVEDAKKCSDNAAEKGISRQKKLSDLFKNNDYVKSFYAPYTLEYDFANESKNCEFIKQIIEHHYTDKSTIEKHISNLYGEPADRYDSVMTVAKAIGKGWYATLLAEHITASASIPKYILEALAFASRDIMTTPLKCKICDHSLLKYKEFQEETVFVDEYNKKSSEDKVVLFVNQKKEDMAVIFIKECEKYE